MASKDYVRVLPEFEHDKILIVRDQMSCQDKTARLALAAKGVLDEYDGQMTVRQLYYQLVARGVLHNIPKAYTNICTTLTKARQCGVIPFEAFEDRARRIDGTFDDFSFLGYDPAGYAIAQVRAALHPEPCDADRWAEQPVYLEVWSEKDALASVIGAVCREWGVPLVICRGYPSVTMTQEAKARLCMNRYTRNREQSVVLYAGDLDPSGWDISRHIEENLVDAAGTVVFERIALNPDQVADLNLPPTEQKPTDTRYAGFQAAIPALGDDCYELDAVEPRTLQVMLHDAISDHFDEEVYRSVEARHDTWRDQYRVALDHIRERAESVLE